MDFKKLKIIKRFDKGLHAKEVILLEGNIIKKTYNDENKNIFLKEADILKKLQGCSFVPKIYKINNDKCTIYMSYCGKPINNINKYKKILDQYENILKTKYGIYHNDIRKENVCKHNDKIYLIDFGWAREYKGKAGYGEGTIGYYEKNTYNKVKCKDTNNKDTNNKDIDYYKDLLKRIYSLNCINDEKLNELVRIAIDI